MQFILFFVVFYSVIVFIQYWQIIKLLILNPFHKSKHYLCTVDEIPKSMQAQLIAGIKEMKTLGFKVSHFIKHQEFYASVKNLKYTAILFNPEHNCYVELENSLNPDAIRPFKIVFITYFTSKTLMGYYAEAHSIIDGFQEFDCFDNNEVDLSKRFECFLIDVAKKETQLKLGERLILDKHKSTEVSNKLAANYIDFLLKNQYVYEKAGAYHFKFLPAVKIAMKLKKEFSAINKNELLAKDLLKNRPKYLLAPEVDAYLRHEKILNHPTFNKWVKTLLFTISAALFVLLFGSTIDYSFALFLLPVLILHEMGHLLAMKIFGYHDLQVLFMPFGAAAIGKEKENTSVLKKVIIYLAGPLPGILLALGLMFVPSVFEVSWVLSLVTLLVIINYLNLLPFMPLDGGQIINHVLLGRYPIAQFLFSLISVIVFISVAYYSNDQILAVFAIFISFTLINQFSNLNILRAINKETFKNKTQLIAKIFKQLKTQPIRFLQKHQKVQTLLPVLQQPKAKFYEIVLGLCLYLAAFFGPLYIVNVYSDGLLAKIYQASMSDFEPENEKWSPEYWTKEIDKQDTPQQKFSTYAEMLEYTSDDYSFVFKPLLEDALKIAKDNNFTRQKAYPALLKANILMNMTEYNEPVEIDETLLGELAQIDNGLHLEYANTLLTLYTYGYETNAIENLLVAREIFKYNDKKDNDYMVMYSLAKAYEKNEDYKKAKITYIELTKLPDRNYSLSQLASFYTRRQNYSEAFKICKQTVNILDKEVASMSYLHIKQCAWIALLDKKHQTAKTLFDQAYQIEKTQMKSLLLNDGSYSNTINSNYHLNMMVLEWDKGNKESAEFHLKKLEEISKQDEYSGIKQQISLMRKYPDTEFSKPNLRTSLTLNAYDDLN